MDPANTFETRTTYRAMRAEYGIVGAASGYLLWRNRKRVRWPVAIALFAWSDTVGYIPGAIAYRRSARRDPSAAVDRMSAVATAPQATTAPAHDSTLEVLRRHGDHSSAFLVVNHEMSHFRAPGVDGFIAYRPAGRYVVQLCGPFAADADRVRLTSAFRDWARSQGR